MLSKSPCYEAPTHTRSSKRAVRAGLVRPAPHMTSNRQLDTNKTQPERDRKTWWRAKAAGAGGRVCRNAASVVAAAHAAHGERAQMRRRVRARAESVARCANSETQRCAISDAFSECATNELAWARVSPMRCDGCCVCGEGAALAPGLANVRRV